MSSTFEVSNGYISLPLVTSPQTMIQQAIAAIQAELPGWVPVEGNIEMILLEQFAAMVAQAANVAASTSQAIFEYYGQLLGVLPNAGAPASALTSWTMVDNAGYTIPIGTLVGYQLNGNQSALFTTTAEAITQGASPGRVISNAQVNNGSPLLFDPANSFTQADVGKTVTGTGIAGSSVIGSVQSYGQATMNNNATANEASTSVTLGSLAGETVAFNVPIQASTSGTANNGLPVGPLILISPALSYVSSIASTTVSSGGTDSESVNNYLNRLSQELQLLAPRPIIPSDFAIIAQSVPGVTRATAYNNTFAGVNGTPANLVINSTTVTLAPATTIASGSNGAALPQTIIDIASTTNFPTAGTLLIETSVGFVPVSYTNITSTTFTGCTGGAGTLSTGNVVSGSLFTFSPFDVGLGITGTGIPLSTTIATYDNPVQVEMSAEASGNETYSPITIASNTNIERAVAVSAIDDNGQPVSQSIANQITALLSSEREINFMVSYLEPSYVDVYVNYIVICEPTATPAAVQAAINTAVTSFLDPGNWAGGTQTPPIWDTTIEYIYYLSVAAVIESVSGVQSIQVVNNKSSLGIGTSPNPAYNYSNIPLAQSIGTALPSLIAVNGSVLLGS